MGVMWGRRRGPCKPRYWPNPQTYMKYASRPMRFHEINTVFGQVTLPEVTSSQIIQEDVGENDKVE
jgi:hypothetical protein